MKKYYSMIPAIIDYLNSKLIPKGDNIPLNKYEIIVAARFLCSIHDHVMVGDEGEFKTLSMLRANIEKWLSRISKNALNASTKEEKDALIESFRVVIVQCQQMAPLLKKWGQNTQIGTQLHLNLDNKVIEEHMAFKPTISIKLECDELHCQGFVKKRASSKVRELETSKKDTIQEVMPELMAHLIDFYF